MSKARNRPVHQSAPDQAAPPGRYRKYLPYLLPGAGALLLYGWTSGFLYALDDQYAVNAVAQTGNDVQGMLSLFGRYFSENDYRPITALSFWLERRVFGALSPGVSHSVNVLLYALLLTLLYQLTLRIRFFTDIKRLQAFALLATLIFLLHPQHVSVVANIKSRDSLLSMLFGVAGLIHMLAFYDRRKLPDLFLAIGFYLVSILSKFDGYALIVAVPMIVVIFRENTMPDRKRLFKRIAVAVAATLFLLFLVNQLRDIFNAIPGDSSLKLQSVEFTANPLFAGARLDQQIAMATVTLLYYLKFMVIPWGYRFYYGYNQIPVLPFTHPMVLLGICLFIAFGALAIYRYRSNRVYLFGYLFFLMAIGYAANLVLPVGGIVMERYPFIASWGYCLVLAAILQELLKRYDLRVLAHPLVILLGLMLTAFTAYRTSAWRVEFSLFERDMPHLANSYNANRIAAGAYANAGLALTTNPQADKATKDGYFKMAETYADKAIAVYDRHFLIWETKGICDLYWGRNRDAVTHLSRCLQLDSTYSSGINYLGVAYEYMNQTDSALFYYDKAMTLERGFGFAANNYLDMLIRLKRYPEADSLLKVLNARFPGDTKLLEKSTALHEQIPLVP